MDYVSTPSKKGMISTVCTQFGKVPRQPTGTWVTRPIDNWTMATTLLKQHHQSDWHQLAVEKKALFESSRKQGDILEQLISASAEERKQNREFVKTLVQSLYFLDKHHIPHATTFESLVTMQIENGDIKLKQHQERCARNATYESYATVVELLTSQRDS